MTPTPSDMTAETIPGDPSHLDFSAAENEFAALASSGAGQPYLFAVKLRDEPNKLHLRAYLRDPSRGFAWADLNLVPDDVRALSLKTSQQSALAWSTFQSGGVPCAPALEGVLSEISSTSSLNAINAIDAETGRSLARYLRQPGYGLFFDPAKNHDAWLQTSPLSSQLAALSNEIREALDNLFPPIPEGDAAAESLDSDPEQVGRFHQQMQQSSFEVLDSVTTAKTRGSAQKAFAETVKPNYRCRCAITGIETREFLVAAHIVPWSLDQTIRLDPSNGICLSLIVDRAFEKGYLLIEDDLTIRISRGRIGRDTALLGQLEQFDGLKMTTPERCPPKVEYLQRRRAIISPTG